MKYYKIDPRNPDPNIIQEAVKCIRNGGVILYPTDTLYGLGVDAFNKKAIHKLYNIKQRDMRLPISIMLNSVQQVDEMFQVSPRSLISDMHKIFPGKVTAIINNTVKKAIFERADHPGSYFENIGFRIPDNGVCKALTQLFDKPISSTSANLSGKSNAYNVQEVIAQIGPRLDMILDAGQIPQSSGSTILDMSGDPYLVVRSGAVELAELQKIFGAAKVQRKKSHYTITFICSGNICRSPMAEGILKRIVSKTKYRNDIRVDSAGTLRLPPMPAHDHSISVADERGIDLRAHASRQVTGAIIENSDLVFCLAQDHFTFLMKYFPAHQRKFVLLRQWQRAYQLPIPSIADPMGHDIKFYRHTYNEIFNEIKRVLPALLSRMRVFKQELP